MSTSQRILCSGTRCLLMLQKFTDGSEETRCLENVVTESFEQEMQVYSV
jgi:hypothetical protein